MLKNTLLKFFIEAFPIMILYLQPEVEDVVGCTVA